MSDRGFSAIGLVHPKTNHNVGAALRAAHCFGAAMLTVEGARYRRSIVDVSKAYRSLPLMHGKVLDLIPHDCVPVAVELTDRAIDISDYIHPERALYIFGPEDGSVPNRILDRCREVISIPSEFCLNLAATVNVVLYDRVSKQRRNA